MTDDTLPAPAPPAATGGGLSVLVGGASGASGGKPAIVHLSFKDRETLYESYIPLFTHGGLFMPTRREYHLGDEVYLMVGLPDDPRRYPVTGRVGWISPSTISPSKQQGVGVRFVDDERTRLFRGRIEDLIGPLLNSGRSTQTL